MFTLRHIVPELNRVVAGAERAQTAQGQILALARERGPLLTAIVEGGLANIGEAVEGLFAARRARGKAEIDKIFVSRESGNTGWRVSKITADFGWVLDLSTTGSTLEPSQIQACLDDHAFNVMLNHLCIGRFFYNEGRGPGLFKAGVQRVGSSWLYSGSRKVEFEPSGFRFMGKRAPSTASILNRLQPDGSRSIGASVPLKEPIGTLEDVSDGRLLAALRGADQFGEPEDWAKSSQQRIFPVNYGIDLPPRGAPRVHLCSLGGFSGQG